MTRKPRGGVGSNQYATRGTPKMPSRSEVAAVRAVIEGERVAAAFGGDRVADMRRTRTEQQLLRAVAVGSPPQRSLIAGRKTCPASVLVVLSEDTDQGVRMAAARNPALPVQVMWDMVHASHFAAQGVALNPNCPPKLLGEMSTSPLLAVRIAVAGHRDTPPVALAAMAESGFGQQWKTDTHVGNALAENPSTPPAVLTRLAEAGFDGAPANPSCPVETVIRMASLEPVVIPSRRPANPDGDDRTWVRLKAAAAGNPNLPPDIIEQFASKPDEGWRTSWKAAALGNPSLPLPVALTLVDRMKGTGWPMLVRRVVSDPDCPADVLERAAFPERESTSTMLPEEVRRMIRDHPNSPPEVKGTRVNRIGRPR